MEDIMDKNTRITLNELMRRKEQMLEAKRQKKTRELYVESLGGVITIEEPTRELVNDCREMSKNGGDGDAYIIYQCVKEPNLKDPELLRAFECAEPSEIVGRIFEPGEIGALSQEIVMLAGYGINAVQRVERIKN